MRRSIEHFPFSVEGHEVRLDISVSVGATHAKRNDDADIIVRRGDMALYSAKQQGRNRSCYHDGTNCFSITESNDTREILNPGEQRFTQNGKVESAKIAIVDDEPFTIAVVKKYLKDAGFTKFIEVSDGQQALGTIRSEQPDLVLLDVCMPPVNGLDILRELRDGTVASDTPVLIFTSETDTSTKVTALDLAASDFLAKPVDASELVARVRNTLLAKSHVDNLANYSSRLEHEVRLRTTELSMSRRNIIQCLARAGELRDDQTGRHVLRVGGYAAIIAEELGFGRERVVSMEHAAQLHDVGKIGVPDSILHKPGKLTHEERGIIQEHCCAGSNILLNNEDDDAGEMERFEFESPKSIISMAATVAKTHHEKWDGSGYPHGLVGAEIPIEGRITAIADVFDALTSKRSYKEAISIDKSFQILEDGRGSHFDPDVLDAFFRRKSDVLRICHRHTDK